MTAVAGTSLSASVYASLVGSVRAAVGILADPA
jgi:hypothetical protein